MKRKLILFSLLVFVSGYLFSQVRKFSEHGSEIQIEFLGPGGMFGLHFESGFVKRTNGFGYTIGLGAAPYNLEKTCNDVGFITIPVGLNYLLGKQNHLLEIGAGAVVKFGGGTKVWCPELEDNFFENGDPSYFYSLLGYRYQPHSKRMSWRAFVSPLFQKDFPVKLWGGAGISLKLKRAK